MHPVTEPPDAVLITERLVLRRWSEPDVEALCALSSDPDTMRYFASLPSRAQIEELAARHNENLAAGRPALLAVVRRDDGSSIGFTGLATPRFEAPFMPCVEVGWRLAKPAWGHGFATEAARAVLAHGFGTLGLDEVLSFTAVPNEPSRAVMRRIGMHHDPAGDFDHPSLPRAHPLRRHVLYRLTAVAWRQGAGASGTSDGHGTRD